MIPATDGAARVVPEQLAGRVNFHRAVSRFWQYMQKRGGAWGGCFCKERLVRSHLAPAALFFPPLYPLLDPSGQAEHKRALPLHLAALPYPPCTHGEPDSSTSCVRGCSAGDSAVLHG